MKVKKKKKKTLPNFSAGYNYWRFNYSSDVSPPLFSLSWKTWRISREKSCLKIFHFEKTEEAEVKSEGNKKKIKKIN